MTNPTDNLDDAGPAVRPKAKGGRPSKSAAPANNKLRRPGRSTPSRLRHQRQPEREETRVAQDRTEQPAGRLYRNNRRRVDQFYIDPKIAPRGFNYEWKRESYAAKPDSPHMIGLRENHWTPVPSERHPELVEKGATGPIRRDGMILMERPSYLTQEALEEAYIEAKEQLTGQEQQIRRGGDETKFGRQFSREHESVQRQSGIGKSYEPIPIPD